MIKLINSCEKCTQLVFIYRNMSTQSTPLLNEKLYHILPYTHGLLLSLSLSLTFSQEFIFLMPSSLLCSLCADIRLNKLSSL